MAEYTLNAIKSAAIKSTAPDTNFSSDSTNKAYRYWVSAGSGAVNNENIVFAFDISPIRKKKLLLNGQKLRLYITDKDTNATYIYGPAIVFLNYAADWSENTITWNNAATKFHSVTAWGVGYLYSDITVPGWIEKELSTFLASNTQELINLINRGIVCGADCYDAVDGRYAWFDVVTSRGANKPQLKVQAEDVPLVISNTLPAGGFVYAGANKQFSWAVAPSSTDTIDPVIQASAKLRYRKVGEAYTEINISGATNSYTIPAGTFDGNSDYEWQIEVTSNDGIVTTSAWVQFTTREALPQKPTLISPINTYVEIDSDIVFSWQHVIDTGSAQTRADLQYSRDGGEWTDLATINGPNMTYTLPANTFIAGNYRWRVRTYNTDNVSGEWSDSGSFVGVGAPPIPYISEITEASRPTISWQSVGQTGYQLQIMQGGTVIYDTGETAGTDKILTLPFYLANGTYTVRIRVINTSLMWSAWAEMPFTLSMTLPSAPSIEASAIPNGAHIEISDIDENTVRMYLLRDGIPVADITGLNAYDDYSALGTVEYIVRVVDENENYADSAPASATVTVESAVLAAVDDLTNIIKMSQKPEGQPAVSRRKQLIGTSHRYAGREHPVHVFSEFSDEYYSPTYYYTTISEWAKLDALINRRQTVLYRDVFGNKYYGSISSVNHTQDNYMIVFTMSIERVDYVEQIPYAEAGT